MNNNWLDKYVPMFPELQEETGASGYFSRPMLVLDPQLFDGDKLKTDVRETILNLFYDYMSTRYVGADTWSMVWLAGSGISYQWAADRGNGDLDVLFGIDYTKFISDNPIFSGLGRHEIAYIMDTDLKTNLWPKTAMITFHRGDHPYEVTYYLNDDVEAYADSIKTIIPYAAYNLTTNDWTIEPPKLPEDPSVLYPAEFEAQAKANKEAADALVNRYNTVREQINGTMPNTPSWHNAVSSQKHVVEEAKNLFDQIHIGRKQAFTAQGQGYSDFYNYQWQAAKRDGIVQKLNQIAYVGEAAQMASDTDLYGAPIEGDSGVLLQNAIKSQYR